MKPSMVPFIFILQIVLFILAIRATRRKNNISRGEAKTFYCVIILLIIWGPVSTYLALNDFYKMPVVIENLPAFWYTMVPVLIMMIPWCLSASFRDSINKIIDTIGIHKVVFFEGLRILAIGGIIKAIRGEFSTEVAFYIGIPDFIFGALSLVAGFLLYKKSLNLKWVLLLNIYGFVLLVPFALVIINMGVPGPWHLFHSTPDMFSMFEYPMVLAPTVVVPIFVVINGFIINYVLTKIQLKSQ